MGVGDVVAWKTMVAGEHPHWYRMALPSGLVECKVLFETNRRLF